MMKYDEYLELLFARFSFQDCVTYKTEPRAWNGDILDHLSLN